MRQFFSKKVRVKPRRWLLLPIETKGRELDGKALLAFEAAERGFGAIIGRRSIRQRTDLPPGMLIEKSIAPGRSAHIHLSLDKGRRVSAWCEEGLVYKNAQEYGQRMVERRAYELLETYFAWGCNQRDDLVNGLQCDPSKIVITGHPRFDLHRPEFRAIFSPRVERIREAYAPFILVNTSFPVCNNYLKWETVLRRIRRRGTEIRDREAALHGLAAYQAANFAEFRTMVGSLSRRCPDHQIIIRPHPSENHDPWHAAASELPNVQVIYAGNVVEWLLAAEISIHNECTTGIEAYLLGRPTVAYRPFSDEGFDLYLPHALSSKASDPDELLALVTKTLEGKQISNGADARSKMHIAKHYISNAGPDAASRKIMDIIDRADLPEAALSSSSDRLSNLKAVGRRVLRPLRSAFQRGDEAAWQRYTEQKFDSAHRAELVDFLDATRQITGRFGNVEVLELEQDLFCVY